MSITPSEAVTRFAATNFRGERRVFGIKPADRRSHFWVLGRTGVGKSTLLERLASEDIAHGRGFCLVDPHGDLAARVRAQVLRERPDDLVDFDVPRTALAFNPLESVPEEKRPLVASNLLEVFQKIWQPDGFWGPRMAHILRNCLFTLLDQPSATFADILRLLHDDAFRRRALMYVANPQVLEFWLHEYENYPWRLRAEAVAPIENKVGAFVTHPVLQQILLQPESSFDLREVMDSGKILIVSLPKGVLGEEVASLLGSLIVSSIGSAALGRADIPEDERPDFALLLDEFHLFTTQSLANMLAELRKYRVSLVLANQYLGQLALPVQEAVLANAGTLVAFRCGVPDAEVLAKEFGPVFSEGDLVQLPNHHIYVKLMVDGAVSRPFSAVTLRPGE